MNSNFKLTLIVIVFGLISLCNGYPYGYPGGYGMGSGMGYGSGGGGGFGSGKLVKITFFHLLSS